MNFKTGIVLSLFFVFSLLAYTEEETIYAKLKGVWKNIDEKGKTALIQFEDDRVRISDDNGLAFYRTKYNKEKVWCFTGAEAFSLNIVNINKDKFELDNDGKKIPFTKIEGEQPDLELKPYVFGTGDISDEVKKSVQAELLKRHKTDQDVRKNKNLASKMKEVDIDNTKYLKEITAKYGWIDAGRFGVDSALTAFLIVQHSGDTPLMLAALPFIEKDVKAKKIDGQDYALLYDRLNLFIGKKQKYGTQIGQNKDGPIVFPLEDKSKVEQYRKELGIFPLSQYLQFFEQGSKKKAVFYEDEIPK